MAQKLTVRALIGRYKTLHVRTLSREWCLFNLGLSIFSLLAIGMPIAVILLVGWGFHASVSIIGVASEGGGLLVAWRLIIYSRSYFSDAVKLDQLIAALETLEYRFASDEPLDQKRIDDFATAVREIVGIPVILDAQMRRNDGQSLNESRTLGNKKLTQSGEE